MSGPKVVRIVSREEMLAICRGLLARVDAALAEWAGTDGVSEDDLAVVRRRREELGRLLDAGRFLDLQKQVPREEAFLRSDRATRAAQAAAAAAQEKAAERRRGEAGRALLAALRRQGAALEPQLERALDATAGGAPDPAAMRRGFALLTAGSGAEVGLDQERARSLKDGDDRASFADWLARQPMPPSDPAIERLEARLAELAGAAGREAAAPLTARLQRAQEEAPPRRGLLLDSLEMDLGLALAEAKRRADLDQEIRLVFAELSEGGSPALVAFEERRRASDALEALGALLIEARETLAREREGRGAAARRSAVLEALSGLGYEVREGLATAWVQEGRVVLRKPAQPGYGVEISGDPAAARLQMRAVALTGDTAGPDPARDRDAETLWCGDVAALQTRLAAEGGGLTIEKALPIGATPLKRVAEPTASRTEAREGPGQRTLPPLR
jgi:hypothetical protein